MSKIHVQTITTTPQIIVEENPNRKAVHVSTNTAAAVAVVYLGVSDHMTTDQECYILPPNTSLKLEWYKGDLFAMVSAGTGSTATVSIWEET